MASTVVDAVAIADWSLPDLTPSLRIGLNHLARALGVPPSGGAMGLGVGVAAAESSASSAGGPSEAKRDD